MLSLVSTTEQPQPRQALCLAGFFVSLLESQSWSSLVEHAIKGDSKENVVLPRWAIGSAKWVIGGMLSAILVIAIAVIPWAADTNSKVSRIPIVESKVDTLASEASDHHQDRNAHPNLDKLSTQIENLGEKIDGRSNTVDKKLDSIDESMRRQWEVISEIRKRAN